MVSVLSCPPLVGGGALASCHCAGSPVGSSTSCCPEPCTSDVPHLRPVCELAAALMVQTSKSGLLLGRPALGTGSSDLLLLLKVSALRLVEVSCHMGLCGSLLS